LQQALTITEGIQGEFRNSPGFRRSIAVILNDRTDVVYRLGQFDEAATLAKRAGELFDQLKDLPAKQKNTFDPLYAAMTAHRRALALRELGKTAEALAAHEDAVARMKALLGPKANRDLRYWDCETRRERARTAAAMPERREAAAEDLVEVIRTMETLVAENPQIAFYRESLAAAYLRRGELLFLLNKLEPATAVLEKSMPVSRELLDRFGPLTGSVLVRGQTYLALGKVHAAARKTEDAVADWKNAVQVFGVGVKSDPDNFQHRRGLAEAQQLLQGPAK
jgi:tetratricopeptide (TPR) repeat protein